MSNYTAIYWMHKVLYTEEYNSFEEAVNSLKMGEKYEYLYPGGVYELTTNTFYKYEKINNNRLMPLLSLTEPPKISELNLDD